MKAVVTTPLFPTEDEAKVLANLHALFPGVAFAGNPLRGETNDLSQFRKLLEQQRIRDVAERLLVQNWADGRTQLLLNKQITAVNIYEDHELGPVELVIECSMDEIHGLVWR